MFLVKIMPFTAVFSNTLLTFSSFLSQVVPDFNEAFEMVPMPNDTVKYGLTALLVANWVGAWAMEKIAVFLFLPRGPSSASDTVPAQEKKQR